MAAVVWVVLRGQERGWANQYPVATHTLKNGMKVLVQTDHSIPNVALYIFYRIGSRNERPGTTGISHFFEHMMFNGAKKYGPGELDKVMEANGGSNNAYTTRGRDCLPGLVSAVGDGIDFRHRGGSHSESEFRSGRRSSRSGKWWRRSGALSVDNENDGVLDEQLWATAYIAHPYQWPVVGWMSDIEHWTMDDLKHHFEMGYSPNNATMVVVGDVSPEEVFRLCEKYIEPIPSHAPPPPVTTVEPEQLGERRVIVHKQSQFPLLMLGYHIPQTNNPDFYALNILRRCFFREKVRGCTNDWWTRIKSRWMLPRSVEPAFDPTMIEVTAQPKQGVDPQKWKRRFTRSWRRRRARGQRYGIGERPRISAWWNSTNRCRRSTAASEHHRNLRSIFRRLPEAF